MPSVQTSTFGFGFMGRRERRALVGLCVLAASIAWLTLAAASAAPARISPLSPLQEKELKPSDTFKECAKCPEMVVVPAGTTTISGHFAHSLNVSLGFSSFSCSGESGEIRAGAADAAASVSHAMLAASTHSPTNALRSRLPMNPNPNVDV